MKRSACNPFRSIARLAPVLAAASTLGCANLLPAKGRVTEFRSTTAPNVAYKVIAVIASDDSNSSLRMSATVRTQLNENGVAGVRRSGRWDSEDTAVNEICRTPGPEGSVQGVVIVSYDTLVLRECESRLVAYKIIGGGRLALNQMADRLIEYVRSTTTGTSSPS
jgi:hypothetical protein